MGDEKKDLTGLMDYAKAMQDSGQAAPAPEGSVLEEQKIEKIDSFESLEEYGRSHPVAETPEPDQASAPEAIPGLDAAPAGASGFEPEPPSEASSAPDALSGLPGEDAFVVSPDSGGPGADSLDLGGIPGLGEDGGESGTEPSAGLDAMPTDEGAPPASGASDPMGDGAFADPVDFAASTEPAGSSEPPAETSATTAASSPGPGPAQAATSPAEPPLTEPLRPAPRLSKPAPAAPAAPLEKVRKYSEAVTPGTASVAAALPFSLMITGKLAPDEQARLLDILARENMGIREIDLEPQLESGRILIPRISEYAGVMLVSALRSARARIRLAPSDQIFASEDTQDSETTVLLSDEQDSVAQVEGGGSHPAENLPVSAASRLPGATGSYDVIDVVTASAGLESQAVEAQASPEYAELLEALTRELKYKAYRKGATAVLDFTIQLVPLHLASHYRLLLTGTAVKAATSAR